MIEKLSLSLRELFQSLCDYIALLMFVLLFAFHYDILRQICAKCVIKVIITTVCDSSSKICNYVRRCKRLKSAHRLIKLAKYLILSLRQTRVLSPFLAL